MVVSSGIKICWRYVLFCTLADESFCRVGEVGALGAGPELTLSADACLECLFSNADQLTPERSKEPLEAAAAVSTTASNMASSV